MSTPSWPGLFRPSAHERPAADGFARTMPPGKEGLLFLRDGQPVLPDPGALEAYTEHGGQVRGHWPSSGQIGRAMMERYGRKE